MGKKYWLKKILKYLGIVAGSFVAVLLVMVSFLVIYVEVRGGDINESEETDVVATGVFIAAFVVVALAAFLITYFVETRRQKKFDVFLNEIGKGNFDAEFKISKKKNQPENVVAINKLVKELKNNQMLKSDFIYGYSHEMKTPLASIKGYVDLLLEDKDLSEEEREQYLTIIKNETIRLADLSNETMLISKLNDAEYKMEKQPFYFDSMVEECVILMDKELKKVDGKVELNLEHSNFNGNKSLLKEVIINLISNSIKYRSERDLQIKISSNETPFQLAFTFEDNGRGIAEENLKYIFNKFYQVDKTKHTKGIGLGLSIVQRIVEIHGGKIEVSSKIGEGTTFEIYLPKSVLE
ncbi:MAG: HAMP domain-containing histidine kinase [Bacilli bacterium]|nr:HAMP domain-containing histidine kinase [Bacilli bacterium]